MSKTGQARVLTPDQFAHLLNVIQEHRYPEKNTALVQISFKLGLRVQEIALLQIKDVAELGPGEIGAAPLSGEVPLVPKSRPPEEPKPERTVGPTRRLPWAIVAALMVVGAVLGGAALWQGSQEVVPRVPLLVGADEDEAAATLTEAGWRVESRYERRDGTNEGQVLATEPGFGAELAEDGTVLLVVSLGPTRVPVPTGLVGHTLAEATRLLEQASLEVGTVSEAHDEALEAGVVLEVLAVAEELAPWSGVDLIVSAGAAPRTVPVGLVEGPADEAVAALNALGLEVVVTEANDEFVPAGSVVSLEPGSDTEVPRGSTVAVVVSLGPVPRAVPGVVGLELVAAEARLAAAGFRVIEVVGLPEEGEPAAVASQQPAGGEEISPDQRVVLVLEGAEAPAEGDADDGASADPE